MYFDQAFDRNKAFTQGRPARPLAPPEPRHLAVLACYDPRLDDLIRPAIGVAMGEAILVRSAGAVIRPSGDPLRSLALATFLFDVREIIVLGHTSCRMARFENASFIEAFRARGVPREAFGSDDLREWVGAIRDPAQGVRESVAVIRAARCLPRDLVVSGLLLDDESGAISVVVRPGEAANVAPAAAEAPRTPSPAVAPPPPPLPTGPHDERLARAVIELEAFVKRLESASVWRDALARLRADLERERNPSARVALVQAFVLRAASNTRETIAAFEALRDAVAAGHPRLDRAALVDLFRAHR